MSNLGQIVDISAGGMRVVNKKLPEQVRSQVIIEGYSFPAPLIARVAWAKRIGFFKHEIGYRFEEVTPELAKSLTKIAASNRFRRVM